MLYRVYVGRTCWPYHSDDSLLQKKIIHQVGMVCLQLSQLSIFVQPISLFYDNFRKNGPIYIDIYIFRVASISTFQNSLTFPWPFQKIFPDFWVRVQLLNISIDIQISLFLRKYT